MIAQSRISFVACLALTIAAVATTACGGGDGDDDAAPSPSAPSSSSEEGEAALAPPTFRVNCDGTTTFVNEEAHRRYAEETSGGSPPSEIPADQALAMKCAPVEVFYQAPALRCAGRDVFVWDGEACVAKASIAEGGSAHVTGSADRIFATADACTAAHADCK